MKDYAMFSDFGNAMVGEIVKGAKHKNLTWREVHEMLETISSITLRRSNRHRSS